MTMGETHTSFTTYPLDTFVIALPRKTNKRLLKSSWIGGQSFMRRLEMKRNVENISAKDTKR